MDICIQMNRKNSQKCLTQKNEKILWYLYIRSILVSQYFCGEIVENVIYYKKTEEVIRMEAVQTVRKSDERYTLDDAVNVLFSKLDSAIDDMENGRVISAEDMWKELERV